MTDTPVWSSETLDLDKAHHLFVCNVGGAGMSAVATLLAERGHTVSGYDPAETTPFVAPLRKLGVDIHTGDDRPSLPDGVAAVVVSTATPGSDPEVSEARSRGLQIVHRRAALAALCRSRPTVAVAGTHGKTTTSALLATILDGAGPGGEDEAPGWVVGAPIPGLGRSATWGGSGPLVVEADESDGTFLALPVQLALVTNVEPDHLEHYGSFESLLEAFERFLAQTGANGAAMVGADDELASQLGSKVGATAVGTSPSADVRIRDVRPVEPTTSPTDGPDPDGGRHLLGTAFRLERQGQVVADAVVPMPGLHNVRNAAMALVAAEFLGVPLEDGAQALAGFRGVRRRFELRGSAWGATLVDDYAHLPSEVAAALAAARSGGWDRVVCVFQPHRYSRTEAHWQEFADAFADADLLAITDVYPAGEAPRPGVSGKLVVDAVLDAHPWSHVAYLPALADVARWLQTVLRTGDVCLTLGAGDLTTLPDRLVESSGRSDPSDAHG